MQRKKYVNIAGNIHQCKWQDRKKGTNILPVRHEHALKLAQQIFQMNK